MLESFAFHQCRVLLGRARSAGAGCARTNLSCAALASLMAEAHEAGFARLAAGAGADPREAVLDAGLAAAHRLAGLCAEVAGAVPPAGDGPGPGPPPAVTPWCPFTGRE
jgi:hypothetical protein